MFVVKTLEWLSGSLSVLFFIKYTKDKQDIDYLSKLGMTAKVQYLIKQLIMIPFNFQSAHPSP